MVRSRDAWSEGILPRTFFSVTVTSWVTPGRIISRLSLPDWAFEKSPLAWIAWFRNYWLVELEWIFMCVNNGGSHYVISSFEVSLEMSSQLFRLCSSEDIE